MDAPAEIEVLVRAAITGERLGSVRLCPSATVPALRAAVAALLAERAGCPAGPFRLLCGGRLLVGTRPLAPLGPAGRCEVDVVRGGGRLAVGCSSGRVLALDPDTGSTIHDICPRGGAAVAGLAFVPNSDRLVAGFSDGHLCVLESDKGTLLHDVHAVAIISSLALAPGGELLAVADIGPGGVFGFSFFGLRLLEPSTGMILWEGSLELSRAGAGACLAFTPSGKSLAVGFRILDGQGGEEGWLMMAEQRGGPQHVELLDVPAVGHWGVRCLAFSPNGECLAAACGASHNDARIIIMAQDGEPALYVDLDALALAFAPAGGVLAAGRVGSGVATLDPRTGARLREVPLGGATVCSLTFGEFLSVACDDGRLRILDGDANEVLVDVPLPSRPTAMALA